MTNTLPLVLVLMASPAFAEETRQLDSHEHGVGELNIAVDGNKVAMEFRAPGADIVGFEYAARSAEDRSAVDAAVATLARPLELFVLPSDAECSVVQASAELELEASDEEHGAHDEDHDDDHAAGHDDDAHEEDHSDEAGHAEFHAEYMLTCGNPDAISDLTFTYFDIFGNAREIEVQIISASGARAFEVERDDPKLDLRGMF